MRNCEKSSRIFANHHEGSNPLNGNVKQFQDELSLEFGIVGNDIKKLKRQLGRQR